MSQDTIYFSTSNQPYSLNPQSINPTKLYRLEDLYGLFDRLDIVEQQLNNIKQELLQQIDSALNSTTVSTELLNALVSDLERLTERIAELEKRLNQPKCSCKSCVS